MPHDNPFEPMIKNIGNYVSGTLYGQGVIPPIGITNYDGTALASPADTHLLAAKDPVIDEIAVGMSGNLIGENTVTGAPPLQLPNSAGYPLGWLNIALSPYQEGAGDPTPDNIRPIHGTDMVTVWTSGDNMCPQLDAVNAIKYNGSGIIVANSGNGISVTGQAGSSHACGFILYKADPFIGKRVYLSCEMSSNGTPRGLLLSCNADFTNITSHVSINSSGTVSAVIPQSSKGKYLAIALYSSVGTDSASTISTYTNISLSLSQPSEFSPNNATSTVIIFPSETGTVYGGTYDAVTGVGTIDRASVDLGTLEWVYNSGYFKTSDLNEIIKRPARNTDVPNDLSSCYKVSYWDDTGDKCITVRPASISTSGSDVWIKDTQYTDASTFTAAMSGVQLVYELSTPIPFHTDGHTIKLPKGTATTWATAEDGTLDNLEVQYIRIADQET